jgi:hypothetical protein
MVSAAMGIGNSVIVCAAAEQADAKSKIITVRARCPILVNRAFSDLKNERHYFLLSVYINNILWIRVSGVPLTDTVSERGAALAPEQAPCGGPYDLNLRQSRESLATYPARAEG